MLLRRRAHGDILAQPGGIGAVAAIAVRQGAMPDDQVAGVGGHVHQLHPRRVRMHRRPICGLHFGPLLQARVETRHALETALVRRRVAQTQHSLHAAEHGPHGRIHIPMDHPLVVPLRRRRRIHTGAIDRHPQLFAAEDRAERLVQPRILPRVPHRLVVVHVDDTTWIHRLLVPVVEIGQVLAEKILNCRDHSLQQRLGHDLRHDYIAIFLPQRPLLIAQYGHINLP